MKRILPILLILILSISYSQTLNWSWARRTTAGLSTNTGQAITTNTANNLLVAGPYNSGITFGTYTLSGTGVYVAKYDTLGNLLFAFKAAGSLLANNVKIGTDNSNNIFVSGTFLNSLSVGTTTLTSSSQDAFIAKYDATGNPLWVKGITGNGTDFVYDLAVDNNNNAIICGAYTSSVLTVGSSTLINTNPSSLTDAFYAKFDGNGNILWAKKLVGYSDGRVVECDPSGNIFFGGTFGDSLFFGANKITRLGSGLDIFVSKHDQNGNFLWAKRAGGYSADEIYGGDIDASNNFYFTGMFVDVATGFAVGTTTITGPYDMFLAKYDSNGNGLWVKNAGGANYDYGKDVVIDGNGNPYVTGYFESPTFAAGTTTLANTAGGGPGGFNDLVVVKFSSSGSINGAVNASGNKSDYGYGITSDVNNNIYITGSSQSTLTAFGTQTLSLPGFDNFYIAKIKGSSSTGILNFAAENDYLLVYPNPSNGLFTIENKENNIQKIQLVNSIGEIILSETLNEPKKNLSFSASQGVYHLIITYKEGHTTSKKIIIE